MPVDLSQKRAAAESIAASGDSPSSSAAHHDQATILVVDDQPDNRFAFATVLNELDEKVVLLESGSEALRYLLNHECAVILLDVNMPDLDGYSTAELIRQREKTRHIPIIFVSAISKDDAHVLRGYGLGAVDYVFKPVDPLVLRSKVSVFVELYKKNRELYRQSLFEQRLLQENLRVRAQKVEAERALRRAEVQQTLIIRSLPIVLYTAQVEEDFRGPRFLGERIAELVGFPAERFAVDPNFWISRIHPDDCKRVLAEAAAIKHSGTMSVEYRWRCADETERFFHDRAVLMRNELGRPQEIFGSCLDITERRSAEQRLFQAQKMEAVGQLTGGLAHDFNNMLTVVIGNLDALARALKDSGRNADRVQMALTGAMSCAELTRRLLAFARRQPLQPEAIDFSSLVGNVTNLIARTLGEKVTIDVHVPPGIWYGLADSVQVESALMNLAVNARDAMPQGGMLTIEAANVDSEQAREFDDAAGEYVMLAVRDTGCGMSAAVLERAFDPFFTTKRTGRGSGLGLSMVYGFVKQSGGHIRIDSEVDQGTLVRLYFPKADSAPQPSERAVNPPLPMQALGARRRVLLVEDDAGVRAVTAALLKELQFDIIEAENGVVALELLRSTPAAIDLLFSDVIMPGGTSGIDLAAAARELRPDMRVLLTSGYSESFINSEGLGELLPKPYREADLMSKLRKMFPA